MFSAVFIVFSLKTPLWTYIAPSFPRRGGGGARIFWRCTSLYKIFPTRAVRRDQPNSSARVDMANTRTWRPSAIALPNGMLSGPYGLAIFPVAAHLWRGRCVFVEVFVRVMKLIILITFYYNH